MYAQCEEVPLGTTPNCPIVLGVPPGESINLIAGYFDSPIFDFPSFVYANPSISPSSTAECGDNSCNYIVISPVVTTLYTIDYTYINTGVEYTMYVLVEVIEVEDSRDAAILGMAYSSELLFSGNKEIEVVLQNFDLGILSEVEIHWSVNGVEQPVHNYDGEEILRGGNKKVVIGDYTFEENTPYDLEFWTEFPNGMEDVNPGNDLFSNTLYIESTATVVDSALYYSADQVFFVCPGDSLNFFFPNLPPECPYTGPDNPPVSPGPPTTLSNIEIDSNLPITLNTNKSFTIYPSSNTFYSISADYYDPSCAFTGPGPTPPDAYDGVYLEQDIYAIIQNCDIENCANPYQLGWFNQLLENLDNNNNDCINVKITQILIGDKYVYDVLYYMSGTYCDDNPFSSKSALVRYNCEGFITNLFYSPDVHGVVYNDMAVFNPDCSNNYGLLSFEECDGVDRAFIETQSGLIYEASLNTDLSLDGYDGQTVNFDFMLGNVNNLSENCNSAVPITVTCIEEVPRQLNLWTILEGAYDEDAGEMLDKLDCYSLIPQVQPYSESPWNYDGLDSLNEKSSVDWVLVELRAGEPALTEGNQTTIVSRQAARVSSSGWIFVPKYTYFGRAPSFYGVRENVPYYISIRHRNHLDVLSSEPITFTFGEVPSYDFTTGSDKAFGVEQLKQVDEGKFAMYAGDYNGDGVIQTTDFDVWFDNPAAVDVYSPIDGNLDGVIQSTDFDVWSINNAKIGAFEIQY